MRLVARARDVYKAQVRGQPQYNALMVCTNGEFAPGAIIYADLQGVICI